MVTRLVLVHSPLVGPGSWRPVAGILAGCGYDIAIPDLTGTVAAGPPYFSRQAGAIAASASGSPGPVVLIGHSGAGPLLAHAAGLVAGVRGFIFVDAGLPTPGQSWMDTIPAELAAQLRGMSDSEGWLPPWSQWWGEDELAELLPDADTRRRFAAGCPRLPLAMFQEVHPPSPGWPPAPGAYLLLSEAYQQEAERARGLGWPVSKLASHHLGLLTDPGRVAGSLLESLGCLAA